MAPADSFTHPTLAAAAALAARGRYEDARVLLGSVEGPAAERALLVGRIAAQQGRYADAIEAFGAVPEGTEQFPAALSAIERARRAVQQPFVVRHARPAFAAAMALLVVTTIVTVAYWPRSSGSDPAATETARAGPMPRPASDLGGPRQNPPVPAPTAKAAAPQLDIGNPRVSVTREDQRAVVEFQTGLFDSGSAVIRADRTDQVDAVGRAIRGLDRPVEVTIIGHTDADPVRRGGRYADNFELALARSAAVASYLRRHFELPAEGSNLRVGAPVDRGTDSDAQDRASKRTVVLRVVEVDAGSRR